MEYSTTPAIIQNCIDFLLKFYSSLYTLYDNVIYIINEPLREILPNFGFIDDIVITLLDSLNLWGGADVSIFELIVGSMLPSVLIVTICYWLLNLLGKILP